MRSSRFIYGLFVLMLFVGCGSDVNTGNCEDDMVELDGYCFDECDDNRDCVRMGYEDGWSCWRGVCDEDSYYETGRSNPPMGSSDRSDDNCCDDDNDYTPPSNYNPPYTPPYTPPSSNDDEIPWVPDTAPDPDNLDRVSSYTIKVCYDWNDLQDAGALYGNISWSTGNTGVEDWSHMSGWNRTIYRTSCNSFCGYSYSRDCGCYSVVATDVCKGFLTDVTRWRVSYPEDAGSGAWLRDAVRPVAVTVNGVRRGTSKESWGWFMGAFSNQSECVH